MYSGSDRPRPTLSAREFARAGGGNLSAELAGAVASGVAFDSRTISPGQCFIALPGARTHGHRFIDAALARGAAFAVSDLPHPRAVQIADPRAALLALARQERSRLTATVVAVTGSAGKTTTKELLALTLGSAGATSRSVGNLNTDLGLAKAILECDPAARFLVVEAGIDRPGEMISHVELLRPEVAVLTCIAASHTEFLGDLAGVAREKRRLLEGARQAFAASQTRPWLAGLKVTYYGLDECAEIRGQILGTSPSSVTMQAFGARFTVHAPGRAIAEDALGALTVAVALGADPGGAAAALAEFRPLAGRLRVLRVGERTVIDDAYNANPASVTAALEVLRAQRGPRTAILGEMLELGAESAAWHRQAGGQAAEVPVDCLIAVGPSATEVVAGALAAGFTGRHWSFPDPLAAAAALPELPGGGAVLVKGSRGIELDSLLDRLLEAPDSSRPGGRGG